jgi:hypothetical protein
VSPSQLIPLSNSRVQFDTFFLGLFSPEKNRKDGPVAKTNFKFQKRQTELEKKKKNEEKVQRKLNKNAVEQTEGVSPEAANEEADSASE